MGLGKVVKFFGVLACLEEAEKFVVVVVGWGGWVVVLSSFRVQL